jgi:hypothetical protein
MTREWGGFHRTATIFLAAVRPASAMRILSLVILSFAKSFNRRKETVTGIVTDSKSDITDVTLAQNHDTGGQSHIM